MKNQNILILVAIVVVVGYFVMQANNIPRAAAGDSVDRAISKKVNLLKSETISFTYTYTGSEGMWAVDEVMPTGWTYVSVTPSTGMSLTIFTTQDGFPAYRFTSLGATKTVVVSIRASSTPGTVQFARGAYYSPGFTVVKPLPTESVNILSCTPKTGIDTSSNCIIEASEWTAWIPKWLDGREGNPQLVEYGNIYWLTNACGSPGCYV